MMRRRWGAGALGRCAIGLVLLAGCAAPQRPSAPANDSAGIAIIDNTAPIWAPGHGWAVGESALVDIATAGAPQSALRLSDGRIVVADARPLGLRFYSAQGSELYAVGGPGDGPGELRSLYHLDLGRADTLVAFDMSQGRAILFDQNGAYVGAFTAGPGLVTAGSNGFLPKGIAPDGRYVLQRDEAPFPFPGEARALRPDSTRLFWLTRGGALTDSSPRLQAGELFGFPLTRSDGGTVIAPLARPLAPALHVTTGPAGVWFGDGRSWEVRELGPRGALERIVRLALPVGSLTPAFRDTFIARYQEQVRKGGGNALQRQFAAGIAGAPFPDHFPAFGDLLAGEDSTLWLLHIGVADEAPAVWTVLDAEGRWLGEVTVPPAFRPTAVGRGWILGIQGAPSGGARVRLYPLVER